MKLPLLKTLSVNTAVRNLETALADLDAAEAAHAAAHDKYRVEEEAARTKADAEAADAARASRIRTKLADLLA